MLNDLLDEEIKNIGVTLETRTFRNDFNALTVDNTIILSSKLKNTAQRNAVTVHELGHQYTCPVNLLELEPELQQRFEYLADRWATLKVMPLERLIAAFRRGLRLPDEYCDFLEITAPFFRRGLYIYSTIYGQRTQYKNYMLQFDPFDIKEL